MNFYAIYSTGADRLKRKSLPGRHPAFIRINPALFKVILMRASLIILLLTIGLIQVHADSFGQQVSLNVKNAAIKSVIKQVQTQTGYSFLYTDEMLNNTQPVTVNLKNATIEETLQQIFNNQPLTFDIQDKTVILQRKQPSVLDKPKNALNLNQIEVTGTILDEQGRTVPDATVSVKGTSNATVTDAKGVFHLKNVSDQGVIVISYIGYQKQELPATADLGTIKLKVTQNKLDEVQVIAYGQTTERLSTGDITTVGAKEIEEQPVSNPLLALEGRVPGLYITQSTGFANTGVQVQVQGQNSIANGNDPFYVVDGVPYTQELLPNQGGILGGSGTNNNSSNGSPLSFLNPSDIESISVLKDAAATAIYGSQAANGAILITTKKGKAGETKVDLNIQDGSGKVGHFMDLMNTTQYLQMRHEALSNDGITPNLANGDYDLLQWDTTRNTNWQKELIGGTAHYDNINLSVSGGNSTTQYLVGATDHYETTVFPGDFADRKVSAHFNITSASANQKFHIQLTGSYLVDNNALPWSDLTQIATQLAPDAPPLYGSDGSLNWATNASGATTWPGSASYANPLAYLLLTYANKTSSLTSNATLSYNLLPGLDLKSSFGYNNLQSNELVAVPLSYYAPQQRPNAQNAGSFANNNINSWIIEPQLSYRKTLGKGTLDALIGSTIEQNNSNGQQIQGVGYSSDDNIPDLSAAAHVYAGTTTITTYKYAALFGRVNYDWNDLYLLDMTLRRDGSSRFGPANEFNTFWSVGAGWLFSSEKLIKDNITFLSFGKLRGSYGTTGNDQIGDYQYLSTYYIVNPQVPYQNVNGLSVDNIYNPTLQWELTKKMEFELDLGFLKDRIMFTTTYFQNRTSNQLLGYNLPITTGFSTITENFPATVQNSGWEITANVKIVKSNSFNWSTNINLTIPQNKLIAFPNLATSAYATQLIIGQPVSIIRAYHSLGVNPSTGEYQFATSQGTPTYNPSYPADATVLINTNPKFYGGIENSFQYKQFSLDVLFQFTKKVALNGTYGSFTPPGVEGLNEPISVINAWRQPGDIKPVQRYSSNYSDASTQYFELESDAAYSDASYLRLKNLSFSWQVPNLWTQKVHVKNARLFLQGQNLLTFTHYQGLDPETASTTTLPPLKVMTIGLQVTL